MKIEYIFNSFCIKNVKFNSMCYVPFLCNLSSDLISNYRVNNCLCTFFFSVVIEGNFYCYAVYFIAMRNINLIKKFIIKIYLSKCIFSFKNKKKQLNNKNVYYTGKQSTTIICCFLLNLYWFICIFNLIKVAGVQMSMKYTLALLSSSGHNRHRWLDLLVYYYAFC